MPRRLSGRGDIAEVRRIKTLLLARTSGDTSATVMPPPTVQNQMIIADSAPTWTRLAAPTAQGQALITGVDPYTPVWGTTFPTVIQFDAGITLGGATGANIITVPDNAAQAMHVVDAGGIEYIRIVSTDAQPVVVFNEGGADVDFRVEAGGMSDALRLMGDTGNFGVGAAPGGRSTRIYRTGENCTFEMESATDDVRLFLDAPADEVSEVLFQAAGSTRTRLRRAANSNDLQVYSDSNGVGSLINWEYSTGYTDAKYLLKLQAGLTFYGASAANIVTVPDDAAQAMHVVDAGGIEYIRIVSTDAQPVVVFNEGGADVDFRVEAASGITNALSVRGSDGYVGIRKAPGMPLDVHGDVRFDGGIILTSSTGSNAITIQDSIMGAALRIVDTGDTEFIRFVNPAAQSAVVFNDGGEDVDFRIEASGQANALFVQGNDGKIGIWASTLNARVEIGGTPAPAMLNLPTNLSTIDAGLNSQNVANESIVTFGNNVHANYTGRTITTEAGAAVRLDTRDHDGGTTNKYTALHILTKAAGAAVGVYTVPFQIAAGAPTASLWITRTGNVNIIENSATVRLSGTKSFVFVILEPAVETIGQVRIPWNCTVTRVDANIVGGTSCTFNIEERGTLGSAGTNVLSSDMVADANGESVTSGFNNSSLAAGNHLAWDISAVSGAVDEITVTLTVTVN